MMMPSTSGFRSGRFVPASFRSRPFGRPFDFVDRSTLDERFPTTRAPVQTTLKFAQGIGNRGTEDGRILAEGPPPSPAVRTTLKFAQNGADKSNAGPPHGVGEAPPGSGALQSKLQFRRPGDAGNVTTTTSPAVRGGTAAATAAAGAPAGVSSASWQPPFQVAGASEVNTARGDIGNPEASSCGSGDEEWISQEPESDPEDVSEGEDEDLSAPPPGPLRHIEGRTNVAEEVILEHLSTLSEVGDSDEEGPSVI